MTASELIQMGALALAMAGAPIVIVCAVDRLVMCLSQRDDLNWKRQDD